MLNDKLDHIVTGDLNNNFIGKILIFKEINNIR